MGIRIMINKKKYYQKKKRYKKGKNTKQCNINLLLGKQAWELFKLQFFCYL